MNLFRNNKNEKILTLALGFYKFKADDQYLSFRSLDLKTFRVRIADIESVSLDSAGIGKNILKINGKGTLLAQIELSKPWGAKAQEFIMDQKIETGVAPLSNAKKVEEIVISKIGKSTNSNSNIDDLEKLAKLKDKGIITQEEFDKKKKQVLGI